MSIRTCDICGKTEAWVDGWEWYGSLAAVEDCGCRVDTCSDKCRRGVRAKRAIDQFDREHVAGHHRRTPVPLSPVRDGEKQR